MSSHGEHDALTFRIDVDRRSLFSANTVSTPRLRRLADRWCDGFDRFRFTDETRFLLLDDWHTRHAIPSTAFVVGETFLAFEVAGTNNAGRARYQPFASIALCAIS